MVEMKELVNFLLCDRRFTWVRNRDCSFSATSFPASRSDSIAACDFRSLINSFSRFSMRVHVSNANSSKRRSSNLNGDCPDSRTSMSSSTTRRTWCAIGSHKFSSLSCARIMEQSSLGRLRAVLSKLGCNCHFSSKTTFVKNHFRQKQHSRFLQSFALLDEAAQLSSPEGTNCEMVRFVFRPITQV